MANFGSSFADAFEKSYSQSSTAASNTAADLLKEKIKKQEEKVLEEQKSLKAQTDYDKLRTFISKKNPQLASDLGQLDVTDMSPDTLSTINKIMAKQVAPDPTKPGATGGRVLLAGQGGMKQVGEYGPGDKVFREALTPDDLRARVGATEEARYGGPKEIAARAFSLRNELQQLPTVKDFQVVRNQVNSMDALVKNIKAGDGESALALDQGLITMFNKITDPQSVVRESEYERTATNLSLANRFEGAFEKLKKGGAGLTDDDREALVFGAKVIADSRGDQYNKTISNFESMASEFGVKPELVSGGYGKFEPFLPKQQNTKESIKSMTREQKIAALKAKKK